MAAGLFDIGMRKGRRDDRAPSLYEDESGSDFRSTLSKNREEQSKTLREAALNSLKERRMRLKSSKIFSSGKMKQSHGALNEKKDISDAQRKAEQEVLEADRAIETIDLTEDQKKMQDAGND